MLVGVWAGNEEREEGIEQKKFTAATDDVSLFRGIEGAFFAVLGDSPKDGLPTASALSLIKTHGCSPRPGEQANHFCVQRCHREI